MIRKQPRYIFFFNDTATTEIYTLSLHDALPISDHTEPGVSIRNRDEGESAALAVLSCVGNDAFVVTGEGKGARGTGDRKSTRLNSSHANISYAASCLQKKQHPSCLRLLTSLDSL